MESCSEGHCDKEVLTYQRRALTSRLTRKRSTCFEVDDSSKERGGEVDSVDGSVNGTAFLSTEGKFSVVKEHEQASEEISTLMALKSMMGVKRTVAPKRVIGQYFLDLGQSDFSYSTCATCGLMFARGHENDEKVHKAFHETVTQGIHFKGWQNERVVSELNNKGNRVIVVLPDDKRHMKKVQELVLVMEKEMGLSPGWLLRRPCQIFLYISSSKKLVGCVMAEAINSAFKVVPDQHSSPEVNPDLAEETLEGSSKASKFLMFGNIRFTREVAPRKRPLKEPTKDLSTIKYSKTPVTAVCGVRVIWVSLSERRKGIATNLLEVVRRKFCLGVVLERSQFAFSQPTPDGRDFATRYFRSREFLVYTDN